MSREIKFRAWDKELKRFSVVAIRSTAVRDISLQTDYEWMQYTGLKDKNEKEIYEGDIVVKSNGQKGYYTVVWYDNGFKLEYKFIRKYDGTEWEEKNYILIHEKHFKVIGNIYENEELLGGLVNAN